jgi:hypothetical protein
MGDFVHNANILNRMAATSIRISGAVMLCTIAVLAQRGGGIQHGDGPRATFSESAEFHFIRVEYTDLPQYHRRFGYASRNGTGRGWWVVDWPDADEHFTSGISRLTRIDAGDPRHLSFTDEHLFEYPWVYATQTGWWGLTDAECAKLREYLLRGGFLMVDDFWGQIGDDEQWEVFRSTMERVLPGHEIVPLSEDESVMHVLYDIREKDRTFIPGTRHLRRGPGGQVVVQQPQGSEPAWLGIFDDQKRMVVAVNFNTDVGDAWEYADSPEYPEAMTALAYRYGLNYIIYSMTH